MEGKKFKCHFKIQSLTLIFIFFFDSNFPINPRNILKSKRERYYFMIEQLNKFLLLFENSYPVSCSSDPPHFFFFFNPLLDHPLVFNFFADHMSSLPPFQSDTISDYFPRQRIPCIQRMRMKREKTIYLLKYPLL